MKATLRGLYAITDPDLLADEEALLRGVEQALRGGVSVIQYRNKSADDKRRLAEASALLGLCRRHGRPLIINDDAELAHRVGADGVHLGQGDGSAEAARTLLGPEAIIGVTCHDSIELALAARRAGADYVAFGAFFSSSTKPGARRAPPELLDTARRRLDCPLVAIGGITRDNAPSLIARGANMVAVVGDLFASDEIEERARQYTELFHRG